MANISIVYHSGYGHTKVVAEAIKTGMEQEKPIKVNLLNVKEATENMDQLDQADCIVMGSPTYMGSVSADFKFFADATSQKWMTGAWKDKLAAGFTNSGSYSGDKLSTLYYLFTLAMQHGMIWIGQAEKGPNTTDSHGAKPDAVNRIGSYSGLMTQSDNTSSDKTPAPGDIKTAELFGRRIAQQTLRWINA